jgi:serine/threonine-protein kinase
MNLQGRVIKRRYRLEERIGIGRTVEVFRARDLLEEREVAVKLPHPHLLADEEFRDSFRSAAHRAVRLHHPGLVETYDYGLDDDRPFVVTELVRERTLGEMLALKKRMRPLGAVYFAVEMGKILTYLHSQGVTHGSLDENHVFIYPGRKAKVSDPGFPTVLGGGKRPYPFTQHPSRDLRDLGYLLYRCVTGKGTEEAVKDIEEGDLEWPSDVPVRFRRLVVLCLQSSEKGGFPSSREMLREAVSTLREEQPMVPVAVEAEEAGRPEEPEKKAFPFPRLKRWQVWAGASLLALAAFVLVVWLVSVLIGGDKVEVPNLVDLNVEEAARLASDLDLGIMVVGSAHDSEVRADCIISQEPKAGLMVRRKTVIKVVKSLGPLTVPNLVGINVDDARRVLEGRGFRVGEIIYRETTDWREGVVMETDPPYGTSLSEGEAVNLVVSVHP